MSDSPKDKGRGKGNGAGAKQSASSEDGGSPDNACKELQQHLLQAQHPEDALPPALEQHLQGCDACQEEMAQGCVIDDKMQSLYPKIREADALVIASPIYWFTVSAQTKLFMDRCYALGGPQGYALKGKRIAIILTYADPDPFVSGAVNALRTFQDSFAYIGAPIVGMVYGRAGEAGEIRDNKDLMDKAYELGKELCS